MRYIFFLFVLFTVNKAFSQVNFDTYFIPQTLRLDYQHAGNADTSYVFFQKLKQEPFWGGSQTNLVDEINYGEYRVMVYDSITSKLIYSRGFATLFQEWRTTDEAKKIDKSFYEVVVVPYPKKTILIKIQERNKQNNFNDVFEMYVNPENYFIEENQVYDFETFQVLNNGDSKNMVDIAFIAEGYTTEQMDKFRDDAERFAGYLFEYSPFKENKKKFNIWAVKSVSVETGTDIPGANVWKNTAINSTFYTFDSERYLTTSDMKTLHDVAALVPYDQIFVLVNTAKYGGGGIYNFYSLCETDHEMSKEVFVHEFGHGFAALSDEYWTSDTSYDSFYDLSVEPYQANITTLVDFDSKWKDLMNDTTPIPTPSTPKYKNVIGVFEGGGYVAKGIYRPKQNCMMKALEAEEYCPVCQKAIEEMIKFYTE